MSTTGPHAPQDPPTVASPVEGTYRHWLRWYPRPFRDEHGEEVLSTLLEGAGQPPRVQAREMAAIVGAGLGCRMRTGRTRRPRTVIEGLRWALVVLLASILVGEVSALLGPVFATMWTTTMLTVISIPGALFSLVGLVSVMRGHLGAGAVLFALTTVSVMASNVIANHGAGAYVGQYGSVDPWVASLLRPVVAMLLVAIVVKASAGAKVVQLTPSPWRYSWAVLTVVALAGAGKAMDPFGPIGNAVSLALLGVIAALVIVAVVEGRAAIAAAVVLGYQAVASVMWQPWPVVLTACAVTGVLLVRGSRRGAARAQTPLTPAGT